MSPHTILHRIEAVGAQAQDHPALVQTLGRDRQKVMTYCELNDSSQGLAALLQGKGLRRGQLVGIFMQRSCEHVATILATLKAGGGFFSINPKATSQQLHHVLQLTEAPFLVVDSPSLIRLSSMPFDGMKPPNLLHLADGPLNPMQEAALTKLTNVARVESIDFAASGAGSPETEFPSVGDDLAMVLFTSGSTGRPKGVMISHQDLFNRACHEAEAYNLVKEDRVLNLLPFSFDVGCNQLFAALAGGATLIISNSWMPAEILKTIAEKEITGVSAVPSIWADLMSFDSTVFSASLSRVRYMAISGGDMALSQLKELRQFLPETQIYKTYGQTETFRSSMLMPHEFDERMGSVGKPVPGADIAILASRGAKAKAGAAGQIIHRGMGTMLGYLEDSKGTSAKKRRDPFSSAGNTFAPRVIYTGDIGQQDEEGFLYIHGRRDKMLKIQGNRVYPKEIHDQLLENEHIQEAVVFGIKRADGTTDLLAEALLIPGHECSEKDLAMFLAQRLPTYMVPSRITIVPSFPRTATGKISQTEVEAKYRE